MGKSSTADLNAEVATLRKRIAELERELTNCAVGEHDEFRRGARRNGNATADVILDQPAAPDRGDQFRQLADSIQAVIYLFDIEEGRVLYINPACERIWGYPPQAFYDDPHLWRRVLHPHERERLLAEFEDLRGGATKFEEHTEYRVVHSDGTVRWVHRHRFPVNDARGQLKQLAAVITDVTDRKQSEGELFSIRTRMEHLIAANPMVIFSCRPAGDFETTYISKNVLAILGYDDTEPLSDPHFWSDHIHPEDAPRIIDQFSRILELGHSSHDFRFRCKDGTYKWLHEQSQVIRNDKGDPLDIVGMVLDITDRKNAEQALQQARVELEARVEQRTTELRTSNEELQREIAERARAEESLRQTTSELRALFDAYPDLLFRMNADGTILDYQAGNQDDLYVRPKQFIGRRMVDVLPPAPAEKIAEAIKETLESGQLATTEYELEVATGPAIFEARIVPRGEDELVAVVRDITDRKKVEKSLLLTQFSVDRAADAVFWVDRDAKYRYVNDAACRSLGYSRTDLMNLSVFDVNPDLTTSLWKERWSRGERDGSFMLETIHRTKTGQTFPVEVSVNFLNVGDQNFSFVFARDISERKRTEHALKASEQRFQTLADVSPVGIFQTDLSGTSVYVNEKYQEILGLDYDNAIGDGWMRALHPDDRDIVLAKWQEASKTHQPYQLEHRFLNPNGKTTWVHCQAIPICNEDGDVTGYVGTVSDITDRKEALQSLAELAHMSRINTMGEMVTGLAHELNQPLTAIANFADAAEQSLATDSEGSLEHARNLLRDIGDQAFRSGEIVRRLRGLVRKTDPHRETVDLNDLVREVVDLNRFRGASINIEIAVDLDKSVPLVNVDAIQIQQVLLNLITNAYDAMSALTTSGRCITIATQCQRPTSVEVSVADSGIELPDGNPQQVFDAFYTTKKSGMGMGLAISRSIIESHDGQLMAVANPKGGATFHFSLPTQLADNHVTK